MYAGVQNTGGPERGRASARATAKCASMEAMGLGSTSGRLLLFLLCTQGNRIMLRIREHYNAYAWPVAPLKHMLLQYGVLCYGQPGLIVVLA